MYFRENDKVKSYKVTFLNRKIVESQVLKLVVNSHAYFKGATFKESIGNLPYRYDVDPVWGLYVDKKCRVKGEHVDYTEIYRTDFDSPFTIAVGAPAVKVADANIDEQAREYLTVLKNKFMWTEKTRCLSSLIHNEVSRDTLFQIFAYFKGNMDLLEQFLDEYHPDLANFRRMLPYIKLVEQNSELISDMKELIDYAKDTRGLNEQQRQIFQTRSSDTARIIDIAETNTLFAEKLDLEFKGRSL